MDDDLSVVLEVLALALGSPRRRVRQGGHAGLHGRLEQRAHASLSPLELDFKLTHTLRLQFELAIAVATASFGTDAPEALAATCVSLARAFPDLAPY